jgi:hypothetical protein
LHDGILNAIKQQLPEEIWESHQDEILIYEFLLHQKVPESKYPLLFGGGGVFQQKVGVR